MKELDRILEEWAEDCKIDNVHLDETSRKTPVLHSKYLSLLSQAKIQRRKCEFKQKTLLKEKWLWYNGKMSHEEILEKGWDPDPFNGLKVLKGDMEYYYDSDPEIQKSEELLQYWKTIMDTLTEIVSNLNWRHQTIGNMIRWKQFESGS